MNSKNFVEIQPVTLTKEGGVPVFSENARSSSKMSVGGLGKLDLDANPNFVEGAYVNLQHHQLKDAIEARGLIFAIGQTHHLPIDDALMAGVPISSKNGVTYGDPLSALLGAAARAGRKADATHVEIKIS
jgi:hypothetical protein